VKEWFEQSGTAGLVVIRVVSAEKEVSYTPDLWVSSMYASLGTTTPYGWSTAIGGVNRREDLVATIETLVYSVPMSKLVWAGVSEKTNPKDAQKVVKELVGPSSPRCARKGSCRRARPELGTGRWGPGFPWPLCALWLAALGSAWRPRRRARRARTRPRPGPA